MSRLHPRVAKKAGQIQDELWSHYLQRRVMRLLLLHDQRLFQEQFRSFFAQSELPEIPLLHYYDRYIRVQLLGEELLAILPEIRRRLSLQTEYEALLEDVPERGDIDWSRTTIRASTEMPDQPPLRFETRLFQQNVATPENRLVVAILLDYRQIIQETLQTDSQNEILNEQERLALSGMEELVEHELAAPYARMLSEQTSQDDIEALIEQVLPRVRQGANPYRTLIGWWESFRDLHVGETLSKHLLTSANRQENEQLESWLYELWIALEILDLLNDQQLIVPETLLIEHHHLQFLFTWNEQRLRFRYQRHPLQPERDQAITWEGSGVLELSYHLEREQPARIVHNGQVIWQEPPVILAASYQHKSKQTTSQQQILQQLLGGMQVAGARTGGIFSSSVVSETTSTTTQPNPQRYTDRTLADTRIQLYIITPDMDRERVRQSLQKALQRAAEALVERPEPACYGILLDSDSVNASRQIAQKGNVLCPKPHIGEGVFDLVDDKLHCLKDPRICHVYGQPITPPFVIRVDTIGGLENRQQDLRARSEDMLCEAENSDDVRAEQLRSYIILGIGRAVEHYVQRHGNTTAIEAHFEEWIFGDYWKIHQRCLAEGTRANLLSGEYVWEEYKRTNGLSDWAAPAIQYCRALESEIKRRVHDYYPDARTYYGDVGQKGFSGHMTLGFLETIYSYKDTNPHSTLSQVEKNKIKSAKDNWPLCEKIVARAGCSIVGFERMVQRIITEGVTQRRNKLAHGGTISQSDAQALRNTIIGQKGRPGILLWLAENLDPVNPPSA